MLEETPIANEDQLNKITAKLSGMQLRRELKLVHGSFDMGAMMWVDCWSGKRGPDVWGTMVLANRGNAHEVSFK